MHRQSGSRALRSCEPALGCPLSRPKTGTGTRTRTARRPSSSVHWQQAPFSSFPLASQPCPKPLPLSLPQSIPSQPHSSSSADELPGLFESAFHRGTVSHYLRPPLPPTAVNPRAKPSIDYSCFHDGFHSSKAQDQISQLTVAIAIGHLARARAIIFEIERCLGYIRESAFEQEYARPTLAKRISRSPEAIAANLPSLNEIIHRSIFGSLLRKLLVDAIKQEKLGNKAEQDKLESEVYEWMINFRVNGHDWAEVDHHLIAGVLKGVLFLKDPKYTVLDYMPWVLPSSSKHSFKLQSPGSHAPTLTNILDSITFETSQTKSFFGSLDKHEALVRIKGEAEAQAREDVLSEVEVVERIWNDRAEGEVDRGVSELERPVQPTASLSPVRKPAKPSDDPTTDRAIPMRLSYLLSNVSTIPESSAHHFSTRFDRQMVLEYAGYDSAEAEWFEGHKEVKARGVGFGNGDGGKVLQAWMWQWWQDLKTWLDQLQVSSLRAPKMTKSSIESDLAFIKLLNNSLVAKVAVVEVIREMSNSTISDGAKSIGLFIALGKAIENEWYAQTIKSIPELNQKLLNSIKLLHQDGGEGPRSLDQVVRKLWRREIGNYMSELKGIHGENFDWTIHQRSKVGALVMKGLLETAKITRSQQMEDGSVYEEVQPAFYMTAQYFDGKRVGVTKMNEAVALRLDRDPANVTLHPRYLPMISTPLPWTNPRNGAYLVHGAPLMRTKDSPEQALHVVEADRLGGLESIYQALDKLGQTAWSINRAIFEVMAEVWNSGIELAGIPVRDPHINLTADNVEGLFDEKEMGDDGSGGGGGSGQENPRSEGEKKQIYRSLLASRRSAYGQRCSVNYQLEIAKAYLHETFYFPHNVDFRGRAYPIPANLNHIGDDISRGLLTFSERKALGERGLFWLKVHLSNKAGFDKASLEEREKFSEDHLDEIFDSCDRPLDGNGWWLKSEDPWQTLAACIELTSALRSPTPTSYLSNLPVHQDGSCNGLQHYAALGGDIEGGKEVNLVPGERPGDVYSKVAEEVNKLVDLDARNGHDIAKALQGHIKRKVVKQTVMTTVYGVTFVGAREQIRRQLKDLGVIPIPNLYISAAYVATLVLRSIGEVFQGAVAIQQWLTCVARLVSKSIPPERAVEMSSGSGSLVGQKKEDEEELMTSMTWTTPLGLVVCQPYRTQNRTQIATVLQTVFIANPFEPAQADSRSQASAFPPNFIHSLDATHMMLTALACQDITFAAVHDSYWTHATDVDYMNVKLRESFVRLHLTGILENLAEEIKHRYKGYKVSKSCLSPKAIKDLKKMGLVEINNIINSSGFQQDDDHVDEDEQEQGQEEEQDDGSSSSSSDGSSSQKSCSRIGRGRKLGSTNGGGGGSSSVGTSGTTMTGGGKKFVELEKLIPPLPPRGKLNIEDVKLSKYFFA